MRNRNKRIWARLNDDEYSSFKRHVEQSGLSQEAYVRFLINDMVPMPKPLPDYFAMTRELRAISMSIRQIASKASSLHVIEAHEFSEYSGKLDKQISAIQDAVELPVRRK